MVITLMITTIKLPLQ